MKRMIYIPCGMMIYTASRDFIQRFALYEERGPLAVDEVSWQGMSLGKFDEEKANTSSVILANARMPPSPTGEGSQFAFGAG